MDRMKRTEGNAHMETDRLDIKDVNREILREEIIREDIKLLREEKGV